MADHTDLRISGPAPKLQGRVQVPGDKSITHRAMLLAALAHGATQLRGALYAGVTEAMLDCLRALGVGWRIERSGDLVIEGGPWRQPGIRLDCRNSGATMRMMLGALAGSRVSATLIGSPRLAQRPMDRVILPLRKMGARIHSENGKDQPPLNIYGSKLQGVEYSLPVSSAQVKTALLLAALTAEGATILREPAPSRDHTELLLRELGITLHQAEGGIRLAPLNGAISGFSLEIPGDFSSAAFVLAAALLREGSQVRILNVGLNPTRTGLLEVLREMGADFSIGSQRRMGAESVGDLLIKASRLGAADIAGAEVVRMIDEFPIFFVLASQAHGETHVRDAGELRHKESDRIGVMAHELRKMGAMIEEHAEGITIEGPTPLKGAVLSSHGDHRVAMALAVAGLMARDETVIVDAECIRESFPGFAGLFRSLGGELR